MVDKLINTTGIKRTISGTLDAIALPISAIPGGEIVAIPVNGLSAIFGGAGLVQATKEKSLKEYGVASLASVFSILLVVAHSVPSLQLFVPVLENLAAIAGGVALGSWKEKRKSYPEFLKDGVKSIKPLKKTKIAKRN